MICPGFANRLRPEADFGASGGYAGPGRRAILPQPWLPAPDARHRRLALNLRAAGAHQGCISAFRPLRAAQRFHVMDIVRQPRRLGIIGSVTGLLGLLVSALTKLAPAAYLSGPVGQVTWDEVLSTGAAALGVLAIAIAVLAVIFREEKLLAGIAAVLGVAAIAVQVWWALILVAIVIVILNGIVS